VSWTRFLIVQGAGRDRTILRLPDRTPRFGDAARPDALLYAGWASWRERTGTRNAGNVIGNYLFDLTIDTGRGNAGAVALSFHSNNHGSIENVTIRSSDGAGDRGLDFSPNWPGPTLIKNVTIDGFDTGIFTRAAEYSLVFEDMTLLNQRQIAILNDANILSIRRLTSLNRVPVICTGGWGMVTLLDSELRAQQPLDVPAHIRYLLGMRTSIGRHEDLQGPTLRIAQESEHPVIFERLGIAGTLEHAGQRVAVFRHNGPGVYQGREGSGCA
jgi:hypothetical protein